MDQETSNGQVQRLVDCLGALASDELQGFYRPGPFFSGFAGATKRDQEIDPARPPPGMLRIDFQGPAVFTFRQGRVRCQPVDIVGQVVVSVVIPIIPSDRLPEYICSSREIAGFLGQSPAQLIQLVGKQGSKPLNRVWICRLGRVMKRLQFAPETG